MTCYVRVRIELLVLQERNRLHGTPSTLSLNADRTQILPITDRLNNSKGPLWFQATVQFLELKTGQPEFSNGTRGFGKGATHHANVNEPRTAPGSPTDGRLC